MNKLKTVFVVGPTASGKSELAMQLAELLGGEILCADSQTIRRGMDIGTAKPSAEDRKQVVHHMLDIIDPYDEFSLADFLSAARRALQDIHKRGKVAVVVGGTGLYIDALFFNFELPKSDVSSTEKALLESMSVGELQEYIQLHEFVMPKNTENRRHLINVILRDGQTGVRYDPEEDVRIVGINPERELLAERISARINAMFEDGFIEEVRELLEKYGRPPRDFDAIGYKIVMRLLDTELNKEQALELFKQKDRQYAKRQLSWLKRNKYIEWFSNGNDALKSFKKV